MGDERTRPTPHLPTLSLSRPDYSAGLGAWASVSFQFLLSPAHVVLQEVLLLTADRTEGFWEVVSAVLGLEGWA